MRLSDAMATGRVLMENWDARSFCGCALGAGLKGAGKQPAVLSSGAWFGAAIKEWPWLEKHCELPSGHKIVYYGAYDNVRNPTYEAVIGDMFLQMRDGVYTFDQIIDYVRANEPAEEVPVDMASVEEVEYASMT